jgi:hemolysin activation/secretion protein
MKTINKTTSIPLIASSILLSSNLLGATPPSSSDILRQTEPIKIEKQESILPEIKVPTYKAPMIASDIKIGVKGFKITNNNLFSEAELSSLLKEYENKELTFNDLNDAANIITKYYKEKGYFVSRGYIPVQELSKTDAIVEISVIEALFGKFTLVNNSLVDDATIQGFLYTFSNKVVSTPSLERQMLLLDDLAGVKVSNAEVFAGESVGTTDFGIETTAEPKYYGYAIADNYGSRYTGEYRLNIAGYVNSVSGRGDLLGINALGSNTGDMANGRVSYATPLGYSGFSLDSSIAYTTYEIGKEFENLDIKGKNTTFDIGVQYPLIKTRNHTLETSLTYAYKDATDEDNYQADREKKVNSLKFALSDTLKTLSGALESSIAITSGDVALNDYAKSNDTLQIDGKFIKLNLSLGYTHAFPKNLSLSTKLSGQTSLCSNLDGGEDFSAGGAYGVRAYTDSELSGDKGYLASLELSYTLPQIKMINHTLSLFADHAKVWDNKEPVVGVNPESRLLSAGGVGYNLAFKDFSLKASYAHGFGADKTPTGDGGDTNLNRAFVQAMVRF